MGADERILSMMGRYPVIKMSLKSAKQPDYRTAALRIRDEIVGEFDRHIYLKDSACFTDAEKGKLRSLLLPVPEEEISDKKALQKEIGRYATALKTLSGCLKKYHGENVIVFLDEYDVPLENAYYEGFYKEMVDFIRSLFESVLKTNGALEFAVVTGCLRISNVSQGETLESIFTGLNHLQNNSVRDTAFSEGFGFVPEETEKMLTDYGISDRIPEGNGE